MNQKKVEFLSVDTQTGESSITTLRVNNIDPTELMMAQFRQNCGGMGQMVGFDQDKANHPTLLYWGPGDDHPLVRNKEYALTYYDNVLECIVTGIITPKGKT